MMGLSQVETVALEDNYGLIGYFISLQQVGGVRADYDEWHGLIAESLVKAIKSLDSSRGALSTLFFSIAYRDFASATRGYEEKSKFWLLGLSTTICEEDWVQDLELDFDFDFDYGIIEDDGDRLALEYLVAGYNQREIAELTGVSQPTISRTLSRVRKEAGDILL